MIAYAVQDGGTDWRTVKVHRGRQRAASLSDELKWLKFGGSVEWAKDGSGFYYSRFPANPRTGQTFQASSRDQKVLFPQARHRAIRRSLGLCHSGQIPRLWPLFDDSARMAAGWSITTSVGTDDRYEVTLIDLTKPQGEAAHADQGLHQQLQLCRQRRRDLLFPDQ